MNSLSIIEYHSRIASRLWSIHAWPPSTVPDGWLTDLTCQRNKVRRMTIVHACVTFNTDNHSHSHSFIPAQTDPCKLTTHSTEAPQIFQKCIHNKYTPWRHHICWLCQSQLTSLDWLKSSRNYADFMAGKSLMNNIYIGIFLI